jgi:hypothetical protein
MEESKAESDQPDPDLEGIDDLNEEERAAIVRDFLKVIADALQSSGKSVQQAFTAKGNCLYSQEFVDGLESLNIETFDGRTLVIFIQSLQSEEEEKEL